MKKRNLFKKITCMILGAAMLTSVCGCTKSEKAENGEVPTLTWYIPGTSQTDMALVMEEANKIIEPAIGARLDLKMLDDGAYTEKMSMMISAREDFDICFTGYVNPYKSSVQLGAYVDITDMLDENAPELMKDMPDYAWDVAYVDNRIYGIPNMQIMSFISGVWFFKDIADKYGLSADMTINDISELEPYLDKIKEGEDGVYPMTSLPNATFYRGYNLVHQAPAMYMNQQTKEVTPAIEMEETMKYYAKAREWHEKGYIRPDIDTAASHQESDLKAGRYAGGGMAWKPGIETDYAARYDREIIFIPFGITEMTGGAEAMTAISKTSKHPEKALQLINLVNTNKELFNLICCGIEGKHYKKLEGEYIEPITNSGYDRIADWKMGNVFNSYLLEGQAADVWDQTKKCNEEGYKPVTRGFDLNEQPIKSYEVQCNAVSSAYKGLSQGLVEDYEAVAKEYGSRLDVAGQQNIREEYQKQFDEWYANKENK